MAKAIKERCLAGRKPGLNVILLENKVNLLENTLINERIAFDTALPRLIKLSNYKINNLQTKGKLLINTNKNKMDIILKFTLFLAGIGYQLF